MSTTAVAIYTIDPEEYDQHPFQVLLDSVRSGDISAVRHILDQNIDVNLGEAGAGFRDNTAESALYIIVGSSWRINALAGAAHAGLLCEVWYSSRGRNQETNKAPAKPLPPVNPPLVEAARYGHSHILELLLEKQARMDATDLLFGGTALHWAASRGDRTAVEVLLDLKADVRARSWEGYTPLHSAAAYGHRRLVDLLLDRGASVDDLSQPLQETPLLLAAENGHLSCVGALLRRKATLDAVDAFGMTPLLAAACMGQSLAMSSLLGSGASAEQKDSMFGRTIVHWAVGGGGTAATQTLMRLLDRDFDIDQQDRYGETALLLAARLGDAISVRQLLARGADPNRCNAKGITPLMAAAFFGRPEVVKLLLDGGAQVEIVDPLLGRSSLLWAAHSDNPQVLQLLLSHGANAATTDKHGATALDLAEEISATQVQQLLQKGA